MLSPLLSEVFGVSVSAQQMPYSTIALSPPSVNVSLTSALVCVMLVASPVVMVGRLGASRGIDAEILSTSASEPPVLAILMRFTLILLIFTVLMYVGIRACHHGVRGPCGAAIGG